MLAPPTPSLIHLPPVPCAPQHFRAALEATLEERGHSHAILVRAPLDLRSISAGSPLDLPDELEPLSLLDLPLISRQVEDDLLLSPDALLLFWLKGPSTCWTAAPHLPAWRLLGPRPLLRTPERSLSSLEARRAFEDLAPGRRKVEDAPLSTARLLFWSSAWLLREDPSLWCVSAWHDQGFPHTAADPRLLTRTDYFPGLGWMIEKRTWDELRGRWPARPTTGWDHWFRLSTTSRGRECVVPHINRSRHANKKGTNVLDNAPFERFSFEATGAPAGGNGRPPCLRTAPHPLPGPSEGSARSCAPRSAASAALKLAVASGARLRPLPS